MADLLDLNGRVIVVSGAAGGGIGTSVTQLLATAGAVVVAVSRSQDNLDQHIAPLVSSGLAVVPVAADASTDEGVAAALAAARAAGPLHGLVNVAGGAEPGTWMPSTRVSRDDWRNLFSQNLDWLTHRGAEEVLAARRRLFGALPPTRDLPAGKSVLDLVEGKWPGTETDAEIREALDRMS